MKSEEEIFNSIIGAILDIGDTGATIDEISKALPLERHTLSKYLNHLRADGRVSYKQIGRAKVWFVSKAPLQHIFRLKEEEKTYTEKIFSRILADMPEGVLILDFDYNILFMNRYLSSLYDICLGQKYYSVFFGSFQDTSQIAAIVEGREEEVECRVEDKASRILDIKARRVENPDSTYSIIAIIRDVTENVRNEKRIRTLSELYRLLGEAINRSYTISQLCSAILTNLRNVISFEMGDILIYDPDTDMLSSSAQIGYPQVHETREVTGWKRRIAMAAIQSRDVFFFDCSAQDMAESDLTQTAYHLAREYHLHLVYAIPLMTKGDIHGALLVLVEPQRTNADEDRSLLEGVSEMIAGGIAKIKAEEEWRLKASIIEISSHPIFMVNKEGKMTYVNPAFMELWGYSKETEVLGRTCSEFWKNGAEDVVKAVYGTGSWEGELIAAKKDGSEYRTRLSASLIIGKKGPQQLVAIAEP
ncbi:MAG: PAS domain-containing protein [Halobacteriota archaeon]